MNFTELTVVVDDFVWGVPLLVLLIGVGLYCSFRVGFTHFAHFGKGFRYMVSKEPGVEDGEVSAFGAFCTAMSATVGTGNIVGVATAVVIGGPGALFWMIVAALIGMGTKYAECLLAVKYREVTEDGHVLGGPFMYILKGMGTKWKWLAQIFAVFIVGAAILGIGTMTQANSIVSATETFFDPDKVHIAFMGHTWTTVIAAFIVAACAALVILGGIKRIASFSSAIVPFMAAVYILVTGAVLIYNASEIPAAIGAVISGAFGAHAVAGGAVGAMILAMQKGVARGCFSNEAGLGSAPIAVAAAEAKEPVRQGLINAMGVFIDTAIICNMTGLSIIVTGSHEIGLKGAAVTANAIGTGLPWAYSIGTFMLMVCLAFFAFTTILGWSYYSERALEFLVGSPKSSALTVYRWLYIIMVFLGPFISLEAVWNIADIFNGLIAIPNLIALLALGGVVSAETKSYFNRLKSGEITDRVEK
ncbi:MAG: alanine:cation symporter family protein [Firmicutes bacterium]|nr:alanine:cation symporter family protein [Bacillota bacterium]